MISRRIFIRSAGASAAVLAVAAAPAIAAPNDLSVHVNERFSAFFEIKAECDRVSKEADREIQALPAWARAGKILLNSEGEFVGDAQYGWPLIENPTPPKFGTVQVRFAPKELRQHWRGVLARTPAHLQAAARQSACNSIRSYRSRIRERDRIYEASGLDGLEEQYDTLYDARWAIRDQIDAIKDRSGNADLIGARILMMFESDIGLDQLGSNNVELEDFERMYIAILRAMVAQMTGKVRGIAEMALAGVGGGV